MKTTRQIYEEMREQMAQRSGYAPDDGCELAVRLYAAAAQIESLYAYADWSRRQCFPQTAVGTERPGHAGHRHRSGAGFRTDDPGGHPLLRTGRRAVPADRSLRHPHRLDRK